MNASNINKSSVCYCGSRATRTLFGTRDYQILQCATCGQARTYLNDISKGIHVYHASDTLIYVEKEKEFSKLFREVLRFILRFKQSGRLVDIGAGVGLLVREGRNAGFEAYGFEPSRASVRVADKHFGIALICSTFNPKSIVKHVDVVVVNHVLEHIKDPNRLLSDIKKILVRDGYLFIGVPNFGNIIAQLKKSRWQSLIPEQHRWQFTNSTLDALLARHGFARMGGMSDNHDRAMHPFWKRPLYFLHDAVAEALCCGEAILVAYRKL